MACADTLWRIFIDPKTSHVDVNSLLQFIAQYQLGETGKIGSDPGFRCMHEVISHTRVALCLDAWRVEVEKRNHEWTSLEAFVGSKPTQEFIEEIADHLAISYVAGYEANIFKLCGQASTS